MSALVKARSKTFFLISQNNEICGCLCTFKVYKASVDLAVYVGPTMWVLCGAKENLLFFIINVSWSCFSHQGLSVRIKVKYGQPNKHCAPTDIDVRNVGILRQNGIRNLQSMYAKATWNPFPCLPSIPANSEDQRRAQCTLIAHVERGC